MTDLETRTRGAGLLIGACLIVAALLFNEWLLAALFSVDAELAPESRVRLRILQAATLSCGLASLLFRSFIDARLDVMINHFPRLATSLASILMCAFLIGIIEAAFLATFTFKSRAKDAVYQSPSFISGEATQASLHVSGEPIYEVTYTLNAEHHRVTLPTGIDRKNLLRIFGGSFAFGEGVEDHESIPSVIASRTKDWRVENRAHPGYGPSHMLRSLKDEDQDDAHYEQRKFVYVYIPAHVRRVIGSMRIATTWGRHFPHFRTNDAGKVVFKGDFTYGRPLLSRAYTWMSREAVLRYFDVDFPLQIKGSHLALTADVIRAARDRLKSRYPNSEFNVLIYPEHPKNEFSSTDILPYLEERSMDVLDYSSLLSEGNPDDYWFEYDGHPTAAAHRIVAEQLSRDLGITN